MSLLRSFDDSDEIILHRLFFALKPSAEAVAEIAGVRGGIGVAKSHVFDHRLHLTLWSLDLPMTPTQGIVDALRCAAAKVGGPALRVALAEVVGNGHVTCLKPGEPMPVLKTFQQKLQLAIADAGIWPNRGFRFEPHVTLAYGQAEGQRRPILPISWRAHDFVLIHSLVGLTEHVELGRWALEG
ncbi:2'-5' RNA ligase family protein [Sphingomonas sp. YL-JM2C]